MNVLSLRIAARFLRRGYGGLALTLIALAAGVALVCSIDLVNRAVLRAFTEIVDTMAGRAALQVTAGEQGLFREELAEAIAAVPGVELAVPVVQATAFTEDDTGELLTVQGVDITNEAAVRVYEARGADGVEIDDPLLFLSQPDSILLTRAFAARRKIAVGDHLTLVTPAGNRIFVVRGLLDPRGVARVYGGSLVVMDVFAAEKVFTRPGFVNRIDVVLRPQVDAAAVAASIRAQLPPGLSVDLPAQRRVEIGKVIGSLQAVLQGMSLVALVAAFLIVFNRLSTVFERRMYQLGIMRAVGARRRMVARELIKESIVVGTVGAAAGIPLGLALGRALLPVIATSTALNYKLVAPDAELRLSVSSILLAVGLGVGTAVLAAVVPAWRAAGAALAEVLRHAGRERERMTGRRRYLVHVGVLGALLGSISMEAVTRDASWGLVATGLLGALTALFARPLLKILERPLVSGLRALPGVSGLFAARTLSRQPRRAGLAVGMLGVGIGSVVWLWTVGHSFETTLIDTLGRAFRADLLLSSSHVASGFDDAPMDGSVVEESRGIAGVRDVVGERIRDWHHAGGPIALDAFDSRYFTSDDFGRWKLVGRQLPDVWGMVARGEGVLASTSFVRNLRVDVGSRITLDTPAGPLSVIVAGVTSAFAAPRGTIEISRALYEQYWSDDQVTRVHLRLSSGSDVQAARGAIARQFGGRYRLRILSAGELLDYWAREVRQAFAGLHAVAGLVLLIVLLGMADTLAAGVVERSRELGTVRAVGGRRRTVRAIVLGEGALLGAIGLLLAGAAGIALGRLWVDLTLPCLLGWALDFHMPLATITGIGIVSVLVCLCAGLIPAARAAGVPPAVALRYE